MSSSHVCQDLDLTKTANFRDLSRPMGAQTPDRLQQFQKRYNEWDDPQGDLKHKPGVAKKEKRKDNLQKQN